MVVDVLRKKTESELGEELKNLKQEQMNLRFQKAYDQLASPVRIRTVRRQIARVKTVMNEKNSEVRDVKA
ncbi:MAG: 50S ribosomal protein L29 [Pseudomonadota bacterium]